MRSVARLAAMSAAVLMASAAGYALGQRVAPTDYKLVNEHVLATIDLAKEIDNVENRELRSAMQWFRPAAISVCTAITAIRPSSIYCLGC